MACAGGFAFGSIPSNGAHKEGAKKLANFLLTPAIQEKMMSDFGAFPGLAWSSLPPALAEKYKSVIATSVPSFPGGAWSAALNDGWYANVATQLTR